MLLFSFNLIKYVVSSNLLHSLAKAGSNLKSCPIFINDSYINLEMWFVCLAFAVSLFVILFSLKVIVAFGDNLSFISIYLLALFDASSSGIIVLDNYNVIYYL